MRAQVMLAGGPCWMEINAEPCHDAGGHFLGYRGTAREIGSQIRREQELARARTMPRRPTVPNPSSSP